MDKSLLSSPKVPSSPSTSSCSNPSIPKSMFISKLVMEPGSFIINSTTKCVSFLKKIAEEGNHSFLCLSFEKGGASCIECNIEKEGFTKSPDHRDGEDNHYYFPITYKGTISQELYFQFAEDSRVIVHVFIGSEWYALDKDFKVLWLNASIIITSKSLSL